MNEILIITIALIADPIISFILVRLTKNTVYRKILILLSVILLVILIIAKLTGLTFINQVSNLIFFALFHLGICYLLWNLIFVKPKLLKTIGIIVYSLFFIVGIFMSYASISVLKNKDQEPYFKEQINGYKVIMNPMFLRPKLINSKQTLGCFMIQVYKEFGPVEKKVFSTTYKKEVTPEVKNFKCTFDRGKKEICLIGISKDNNVIWKDIINEL